MRLQTLSEARWIFASLALAAAAVWFVLPWLSVFFLMLILCTLAFFRDPDRASPTDPSLIVAAADGTVTEIVEIDENEVLKRQRAGSESFCRFSMCTRIARQST